MPVSSFYGMQTSLRGFIAQQRMLDTTGHNIANASTVGYSRQEATLQASLAQQIQTSGSANQTGAHLGHRRRRPVGFRRIRDQFLDAQYRAQNTNLNDWKARAEGLDSAELSLAEPGENGINAQLAKFWKSWSDLSKSPDDDAAKQALVQQAKGLADSIHSVRSQMVAAQEGAMGQYDAISPVPGGEIAKIATELADLNTSISKFVINGDHPNDLMDRRDVLIDQLSQLRPGLGRAPRRRLDERLLRRPHDRHHLPDRLRQDRGLGRPAGRRLEPGRPDRRPARGRQDPGRHGRRLPGAHRLLHQHARLHGQRRLRRHLLHLRLARGLHDLGHRRDPGRAGSIRSGTGAAGSNDLALAISQLRGNAGIDGAYKAFVAKVGGDLNEASRMQGNAQVLTDSVENRRQSVEGVSMDEEMSNLVRFQRAYQASARAMSTMDEMLDVLINRTGRVGL